MLCESTFGRVETGKRAKLHTWQNVFPGRTRRVTLPSKASDRVRGATLKVGGGGGGGGG